MSNLIGPLPPHILGNLSANDAVSRFREFLLCEARYAGLAPDTVTISANVYVSDGGIDADVRHEQPLPTDTFLRPGRAGIQLKTGTSFKPWTASSLRAELLTKSGDLVSEVRRTLEDNGHYVLVCFGLDFTPQQRNDSHAALASLFGEHGFHDTLSRVTVLGQGQVAAYFDRYPSLRLSLLGVTDDGLLSVAEWGRHAHMANALVPSDAQQALIEQVRQGLRGDARHLRVLGEAGIGKTRLVLEAVRAEDLCPLTVYVQQGERFGQSALFRDLLRSAPTFPLILVLDELSEREMTELWGHLKERTGNLKLVSIDHAPNRTRDTDIVCIQAPRLPDDVVKAILAEHVGTVGLERWVPVCEGSPRVAQAVGANLAANPDDILRPPATVPFWDRFLYGYATHESADARHIATVMRHVALFSRFGFEEPVSDEAKFIASLANKADSDITWARFQEVVQVLRERRVIQGTRTLFIVPWALHIYLWREYWRLYGRGFDFASMLDAIPASLHGWFLEMFRYAHDSDAATIVKNILRPDGIFANRAFLTSATGGAFLGALAEADPGSCLRLLEQTVATWSADELRAIEQMYFVRVLEKIAVWRPTAVRAMSVLTRLALAENSKYSNNATGVLLGLFRIGPEWSATEAPPIDRIPALLSMLRDGSVEARRLGLKSAEASLAWRPGIRIIGPEYQGLKQRAKLWVPDTYDDWWAELRRYLDCLVTETRGWDGELLVEANSAILTALEGVLRIKALQDAGLKVLYNIAGDANTDSRRLNRFLTEQIRRHRNDDDDDSLRLHLRRLAGRLARKDLRSRFQRYVLDVDWTEWEGVAVGDDDTQRALRGRQLLVALARRFARDIRAFQELSPTIAAATTETGALFHFGEALAEADTNLDLLQPLLDLYGQLKSSQCIGGYLAKLRHTNPPKWQDVMLLQLGSESTAADGAELVWRSGFNDVVFDAWVAAYERGWIPATSFAALRYGMKWKEVPVGKLVTLLHQLAIKDDNVAAHLLVDLLDQVLDDEAWPVEPAFVLRAVCARTHFVDAVETMHSYHWERVCKKLVQHTPDMAAHLLDVILTAMEEHHDLSYDSRVAPTAHMLCTINPAEAWPIVTRQLLSHAPKWRGDILHWLEGGLVGFRKSPERPPIAEFPVDTIMEWVAQDVEDRASMIAHAAPGSLEDRLGGEITRRLIAEYSAVDGVISGISATFHSGGWQGPESQYLRNKRNQFRSWLGRGFDAAVCLWIEDEIRYLDGRIEACEIDEEREQWNRPTTL